MKLRTKLTVSCLLLLIIAIALSCAIILRFAHDRAIEDAVSTALNDLERFADSFSYPYYDNLFEKQIVQRSYVIHRFRDVTGSYEYTLRHNGEYLSNNAGFAPEALLNSGAISYEDGRIQYRAVRVEGVDYLIAHRTVNMEREEYSVCLVRNITELTDSIRTLAIQCVMAGAGIILLAALIMWRILFRALKPVEQLKAGATELAAGHYENRIAIRGRDELAELATDFNSMADAIEANIGELHERAERQQAFINDLSHEMKTPVTSILLNAEMLLGRRVAPEVFSNALERIYDQGKWLERLSQKLMTLVMLQGEIELREESVAELFEAVKGTTEGVLQEKNMELVTECSIDTLPMDFDLMRSALANLVENAKRASSEGQTIILAAHGNVIEVIDHGKGIPVEEIARITEPFYMVDRSRSKRNGGSGLGMALVQKIAEAHGAELVIESVENEGTTMRLIFPGEMITK